MSRDVYKAIGYEEENGKKAIQNVVPNKYKLRFGDVKPSLNQREDIFLLHKDTVLLKEPGLYCFLLRSKRNKAKSFMDWAVETALQQEVRKLASVIKEVARRGCFDNVLCFIKKNSIERHPYYVIRCQYRQLEIHKQWLRLLYPNMELVDECDDPNAIH